MQSKFYSPVEYLTGILHFHDTETSLDICLGTSRQVTEAVIAFFGSIANDQEGAAWRPDNCVHYEGDALRHH